MIHGISSNHSSFKDVQFSSGLNVILAERQEKFDQKKTVNSRGKSTLVSIINFCLGSSAARSDLCIDALQAWSFTIEITLHGDRIKATRAVENPNRIVMKGQPKNWPFMPELDRGNNEYFLPLKKWKELLGQAFFNLPQIENMSSRSLLSYFVRSSNKAYFEPLKFFASQADNIAHIHNAFFVGLDPRYAAEWVSLDKQGKALKYLYKALKTAGVYETQGELEAKKIACEEELQRSRNTLSDFKVHEQYQDIQVKANDLTAELHRLVDQNISNGQKLEHYQKSVEEEEAPERAKLEQVYQEAGLVFADTIKKTLAEACTFHEQIVRNRAAFLKAEITRIENDIEDHKRRIKDLTDERSECMEILKTHGALEEYSRLQEQHSEISERLERIKSRIEDIRNKSIKDKEIKAQKFELDGKARIDYEEKRELWAQAIKLFNEVAKLLYEVPGEFVIDISDKGYRFKVDIPGGRGNGIGKMKIFCYDLMVVCMQSVLGRKIDFLVHDSIIYEGVDKRQRAQAIAHAHKKSEEYGFQYIITMNSDDVPYDDFPDGFDFDSHIKLKLTDKDASGSLLGIRY